MPADRMPVILHRINPCGKHLCSLWAASPRCFRKLCLQAFGALLNGFLRSKRYFFGPNSAKGRDLLVAGVPMAAWQFDQNLMAIVAWQGISSVCWVFSAAHGGAEVLAARYGAAVGQASNRRQGAHAAHAALEL